MQCDALISDEQTDAKEVFSSNFAVSHATQGQQQNHSSNNNRLYRAGQEPIEFLSLSETFPKWFVSSNPEQQGREENPARESGGNPAACTDDCNETEPKSVMPSTQLEPVASTEEQSIEIPPESFQFHSTDEEVKPKQVDCISQDNDKNLDKSLGFQPESFDFNSQEPEVKPKKITEGFNGSNQNDTNSRQCWFTEPKHHCSQGNSDVDEGGEVEAQTNPKKLMYSSKPESVNCIEQEESIEIPLESFQFPSTNDEVKPKQVNDISQGNSENHANSREESCTTEPKYHCTSNRDKNEVGEAAQTTPKQVFPPPKGAQSRETPPNFGNTNNYYLGDVVTHIHHGAPRNLDITSRVDELKEQLRENAKGMCADIDPSSDDAKVSHTVKLQVSTYNGETAKQLNEIGHFCHRDEFEYVFSAPKGDVALEGIFSYAEKASRDRRSEIRKRAAHRILINGQAGIGKTVLTKMLTRLVLQGNLLPGCQFVFYIRFRDINCDENRSLLEILLSSCGCEWEHSKEADTQLWALLKKNPNVLIVLDGLDEAKGREMLQRAPKCNPLSRNKVSTQLKNLISGNSLPEAKLVVTSRPRDGNALHPDHKPRTVLQVIGLDEEAQNELGRDICGQKWPQVKSFIHENPHVQGICYVPVFCVLVMKILFVNLSGKEDISLSSLTKILVAALDNYTSSENVRENREDLARLALLAFTGFRRRNYMFEEVDLEAAGISDHGCQSFLSTLVSNNRVRILQMGKKSYFSHLVWQELFTAIYLLFFATQADFEKFLRRLHKRRWEVVARCLYGLCNAKVFPIMRQTLGLKRNRLMMWKRDQLRKHALTSLKGITNNAVNTQGKVESLIGVCTWFYELGDPKGVAGNLPNKVILQGSIYPADVASLMFCLKESFDPVVMNIRYHTQFVGKSMLMLFTEIQDSPVTLHHLTLTRNKISDEAAAAIAKCLRSPKTMYIDRSEMSEYAITTIMEAIGRLPHPLAEINLTENQITDGAAEAIAHVISNINIIIMRNCKLSPYGFRVICQGIKRRHFPMEEFYVRANRVTDEVARYIAECMPLITRLYAHECEVTVNGAGILSRAIKNLEQPMDELYLHMNQFGDLGVVQIAHCLHKIRYELRLDKCGCTPCGYEDIHEAYQDAQNKPEIYLGFIDEQLNDVKLNRVV